MVLAIAILVILCYFLFNKGVNMEKQQVNIKQFIIAGTDVVSCKYNPENRGKGYYTFKPLTGKSNKKKFFDDAFNWFSVYIPGRDIDKIKFKLQSCHYNINNNRAAILGFFKNLKRLKAHHFDNWSFSKFYRFKKEMDLEELRNDPAIKTLINLGKLEIVSVS